MGWLAVRHHLPQPPFHCMHHLYQTGLIKALDELYKLRCDRHGQKHGGLFLHDCPSLQGSTRWQQMREREKKDNVLKNENFLKVSGAGCCLPGPSSTRPSRDTCFLCLQQVGMELDENGKKLREWK